VTSCRSGDQLAGEPIGQQRPEPRESFSHSHCLLRREERGERRREGREGREGRGGERGEERRGEERGERMREERGERRGREERGERREDGGWRIEDIGLFP